MNSKEISVIAIFTALAIVLNMSPLKIPAPFAPFLFYQVWEIPIITAYLLYGLGIGVLISIINTIVLLIFFPGALPTGPIYNLLAILSTIIGIIISNKVRKSVALDSINIIVSTIIGIIMRVLVMTIVNWVFMPLPMPIGFNIPREAVTAMLPVIGLFNATLNLYTIPLSYILAKAVETRSSFSKDMFRKT
jgi:riboflavin transporter FmnP